MLKKITIKKVGNVVGIATILLTLSLSVGIGEAQNKVTLTYWEHQFPDLVRWTKEAISEYEKLHPDVSIKFSVDYAHKRLLPAMYIGKGPDISAPHGPKVVKLLMMGYLAPVDLNAFPEFNSYDEMREAWFPKSLLPFTDKNGVIYGMPLEYDVPALIVNEKLFRMAGIDPTKEENIPKTWKEVGEIGGKIFAAIGKENGKVVYEGWDWAYHYRRSWQRVVIRTILAQYGAKFVNEKGEVVIDSPEAIRAFQMMKDMIHKYKTGDPTATPGAEGRDWQMFNGRLAMGRFLAGEITRMVSPPEVAKYLKVYTYPKPADRERIVTVRTHAWMVNGKISKEKQLEAWKFINFLTKKWKHFAIVGFNPARIKQPGLDVPWYKTDWFKEQMQKYPSLKAIPFETLEKGDVIWLNMHQLYGTDEAVLRADEIADIVADAQERIIFKGEDVEKALKEAKKEIERILMVEE